MPKQARHVIQAAFDNFFFFFEAVDYCFRQSLQRKWAGATITGTINMHRAQRRAVTKPENKNTFVLSVLYHDLPSASYHCSAYTFLLACKGCALSSLSIKLLPCHEGR